MVDLAEPLDCAGLLNMLYDMIAMAFERAGLPVVIREQLRRDPAVRWGNHPELHETGVISAPLRSAQTGALTTMRRFHCLVTPKDENVVTQRVQFEMDIGHLMALNEHQLAIVMLLKMAEVIDQLRETIALQKRAGGVVVEQGLSPRVGRA